jgi:hypothetical protein
MNYFGAARHSFRFGVDGVSPNKTSRFLMSDTILEEEIMEFHKELDARGLNCPLPILKAKKRWQNCRAVKCCASWRPTPVPCGISGLLQTNRQRAAVARPDGPRVCLFDAPQISAFSSFSQVIV